MSEREIRSFKEKVRANFKPKRFLLTTFGSGGKNATPLVLELDQNEDMWRDGVGRIKIGDAEVHFDINEMISYLTMGVQ